MKSLGKSRVGWGCGQAHVVGARSFLIVSWAEGRWYWSGRAQQASWEQDRKRTYRA